METPLLRLLSCAGPPSSEARMVNRNLNEYDDGGDGDDNVNV